MALSFSFAQLLYLDSSAVKGATEVAITRVDLYFRAKPPATGNKSGIEKPGCEIMILPTKDGLPVINQIGAYRPTEPTEHGAKFAFYSGGQIARKEWEEILPSTNASVPTTFLLSSPAFVKTNQEYAIVVKFDGGENFVLWTSKTGETLVDSSTTSPGPSNRYIGPLYEFVQTPQNKPSSNGYAYSSNPLVASTANNSALLYAAQPDTVAEMMNDNYLRNNWNPVVNTYLKFELFVAKYSHNGQPVVANSTFTANGILTNSYDHNYIAGDNSPNSIISNNVIRLFAPTECQEYIRFDKSRSVRKEMFYGEPVYQRAPQWPNDKNPIKITCAPATSPLADLDPSTLIQANSAHVLANGSTFASVGGWNAFDYIGYPVVIKTANNDYMVRSIIDVIANNYLQVDLPFDTTYANATLMFAPVAFINDVSPAFVQGKRSDILVLYDSFLKPGLRFVSHAVDNITVANSGTGYSNTDVIRITGFEYVANVVEGNYAAYANIVTDASGNIANVYMANCGAGFVNPAWLTGANVSVVTTSSGVPTNTSSSGTGASFNIDVNSKIHSVFTDTMFSNCEIVDLDAARMKPEITVNNPVGTAFTIKHRTQYYRVPNANTVNGSAVFMNSPEEQERTDTYVKIFKGHSLLTNSNRVPVIPSRSNQVVTRFANGAVPTANDFGDLFSNAATYIFEISSNNEYQVVYFDPEIVNAHYAHYIVNRDYSLEHTNIGHAWAKHITSKINLNVDRLAENLLVYLTAYKPAATDIKVYARIHNSADNEEFDDKDWTLMQLVEGKGLVSSTVDTSDYIELGFNFPSYPNSEFNCNGSVTIYQGNAVVTGVGTTFLPTMTVVDGGSGYANGDVVRFLPPEDSIPLSGSYAQDQTVNAVGIISTNTTGGISSITVANTGKNWPSENTYNNFVILTSGGSGANVTYKPGLAANDLVKIYSPLFPNTNYVVAVVNNVVNNTSFRVKRALGDLAANSAGTVEVNTSSVIITGTGTDLTEFSEGDFIAVWANSSVYEVRRLAAITNSTSANIESGSNWTISGSGLNFAYVTANTFNNTSITVTGLQVDRLHYKNQAYNDVMNKNVVRYHNGQLAPFDGFDTFQIKLVMLGESTIDVPRIADCRAIAASA